MPKQVKSPGKVLANFDMKECIRCNVVKSFSQFPKQLKAKGGRSNICVMCTNIRRRLRYLNNPEAHQRMIDNARAYRAANPQKIQAINHRNYWKSPEYHRQKARERRAGELAAILAIYDARCSCCGEVEKCFLTIDHVNHNGKDDRARFKDSRDFYRWLSKQPKLENYRILCYNCNCGRERNKGICPHELLKKVA